MSLALSFFEIASASKQSLQRAQNRRPYWIEVDPANIYGWRLDREVNYGNLIQVRIGEKAVVPDGDFGEKVSKRKRLNNLKINGLIYVA